MCDIFLCVTFFGVCGGGRIQQHPDQKRRFHEGHFENITPTA